MIIMMRYTRYYTRYIAATGAAIALLAGASSCQDDYTQPELEVPEAVIKPNTTILELKKEFKEYQKSTGMKTCEVQPVKTADGATTRRVIHGFVVSSDATGNIYQSLVIQDETAAIQFSISRASLWTLYPLGQEIVVDVTGMTIGVYGNLIQIGDYYENNGEPQVGRMLYARFKNQSQLNGLPNDRFRYVSPDAVWPADGPYVVATSIEAVNDMIGNEEDVLRMQSQLVRLQNVHWQDAGKVTYAEYEESSRRYLLDNNNGSLMAYNSGYSTFYNSLLPEGIGAVEGILSYYGHDDSSDNPWQLLLRSRRDVQFGDVEGSRQKPYTVDQVIALDNCGLTAWAQGYIVGAFDFSGNPVFGVSDTQMDDNLLIAPEKDCRDIGQCVCVRLPAGPLRQYGALPDNPDVLGRLLSVTGAFSEYYGMHGILVATGAVSDFAIEGIDTGAGLGTGTADSPFTVEYVLKHYTEPESGVWMTGFIVGYYDGKEGACFSLPADGADYNGANVLVAADASCRDASQCVYMSVDRNKVGLKKNPGNLGKKINAQGSFDERFDMAAFIAGEAIVE